MNPEVFQAQSIANSRQLTAFRYSRPRERRDLLTKLYDGDAGIAGGGQTQRLSSKMLSTQTQMGSYAIYKRTSIQRP